MDEIKQDVWIPTASSILLFPWLNVYNLFNIHFKYEHEICRKHNVIPICGEDSFN